MSSKVTLGPSFKVNIDSSLGRLFFKNAHKFSKRTCQIDGKTGSKETFGYVIQKATRLALHIQDQDLGLQPHDIIVICMTNTTNNCIPALAGLLLGATIANLDPLLSVKDCTHLLKLVCPKVIFTDESAIELMEQSIKHLDQEIKLIVNGSSSKYPTLNELTKPHKNEACFKPVDVDVKSNAFILFSSGSTGLPKGIELSHYGIQGVCLSYLESSNIDPSVMLHYSSLYWISAIAIFVICFLKGTTKIAVSEMDPEKFFKMIEDHKITYAFLSSTLAYKLRAVKDYQKYNTSSLYSLIAAGNPMGPNQLKLIKNMFPKSFVALSYGQTEVGFTSAFNFKKHGKQCNEKLGSSGTVIPGLKVKIVDLDSGKAVGSNRKGEIRVLSPFVMNGYYKADSSSVFDEEGYLKSGDVGYFDDEGFLYVVDRIKEMFKFRTWHVVPASIEAVLVEHPAVKESIVFGIPKEEDEIPAAVCVLHENTLATPEDIEAFVEKHVSDYQRLRGGVLIVDELPKTPSGKIKRKEVKELYSKFLGKKPYN